MTNCNSFSSVEELQEELAIFLADENAALSVYALLELAIKRCIDENIQKSIIINFTDEIYEALKPNEE